MPLISIIVPCYNSARFLGDLVASVQAQTVRDWQLILVDDGSQDATWRVISEAAKVDPRVRALRKANEGTCRARNDGFAASDPASLFLFFLDHDDMIAPTFIEEMCGYLTTNQQVGLLACQFEDLTEDGQRAGTGEVIRWTSGPLFPRKMRGEEIETSFATVFAATGRGPFAVYRRSVYEKTTGWETGFWPDEDSDMFCQMALLAKVHFIPDKLYYKRCHPEQGSGSAERLAAGATAFRRKWDNMISRDGSRPPLIADALHYYYRRHLPFWNLISAAQAGRRLFRTGTVRECSREIFANVEQACRRVLSPLPPLIPQADLKKVPFRSERATQLTAAGRDKSSEPSPHRP